MDNGLLSDTAKHIYKPAESVSFTCNTGYKPESSKTTCLPTTDWSPPPVCNIVNCTVPAVNYSHYFKLASDNVTWEMTDEQKSTYRTTLKVQCNQWYEITNGSNTLKCQEDGTWSPSPPQCVKILCNDWTDISHAPIYNYPQLGVGESGTVSYNSTYFYLRNGSLEVTCTESRKIAWSTQPFFGKVLYNYYCIQLYFITYHWIYIKNHFTHSCDKSLHLTLSQFTIDIYII